MAKPEGSDDWTESLITRVSPKAKRILNEKLASKGGVSAAAWLRDLIYRELGISTATEDKSHG